MHSIHYHLFLNNIDQIANERVVHTFYIDVVHTFYIPKLLRCCITSLGEQHCSQRPSLPHRTLPPARQLLWQYQ